jgi:hypothetical protein
MVPVPLDFNRTPWTIAEGRRANVAVVEFRHSRLGERGAPPSSIETYGLSLRLWKPGWLGAGEYAFALYRKDPLPPGVLLTDVDEEGSKAGRGLDELFRDGFEGRDACAWSDSTSVAPCP